MIAQELGRRLKNERKAKGFTQKVMAGKMGMVLQQYQTYESGRYQLDYEKLKQVCIILDISADYLLGITQY